MVVLHDAHNVFMFMNFDQTLFVTSQMLKVAQMNEAEVALMISHELSHYLLEHQVSRLASFWAELYVRPRMFDLKKELREAIKEEFKEKTVLQKISCFYPQ